MPFPQVLATEGVFCYYSSAQSAELCSPASTELPLSEQFSSYLPPKGGVCLVFLAAIPLRDLIPRACLDHTLKGRTVLSRGYLWLFSLKNGAGRSNSASFVNKLTRAMWYLRLHLRLWPFSSACPLGNSSTPPWTVAGLHQNINSFTLLRVFLTGEWWGCSLLKLLASQGYFFIFSEKYKCIFLISSYRWW